MLLSEHMKETADIISGFTTGTMFVLGGIVGLQLKNGEQLFLNDSDLIEVRNDTQYIRVSVQQIIETRTDEGWPLFGGVYTRVKKGRV
ncbi:hypothetical protein [Paenibacillus methanolicus]|uniref:Uncharacterized protein n=1 Tax=Paenibacillus methanolicus TaxID=582686 RepID=A0A5S5BSA8_9BACL|nr:hypothetical protein [Paenibacillus methanolicus]TYP69877.1 hypothetical protein BCM02_113210 [Paenibacillus methanolicus]